MPLPDEYLQYAKRRPGMDHEWYTWSNLFERAPLQWPGQARVALWVVTTLEFFPLNPTGQPFKAPGSMVTPYPDYRHYTTRDYGNRVGLYRLFKLFDKLGINSSYALNAAIAQRYPQIVEEINRRGGEIIAHGQDMDKLHYGGQEVEAERTLMREALQALRTISGQAVTGWLSPAKSESWQTLALAAAEGVEYVCDWCNDDLPYPMTTPNGVIHALPLSTELSDRQILLDNHHNEAEFVEQIKDQFDTLYEESARYGGRVLALTLTPYIAALPFRVKAIEAALAYVMRHPGVWTASGADILAAYKTQTA